MSEPASAPPPLSKVQVLLRRLVSTLFLWTVVLTALFSGYPIISNGVFLILIALLALSGLIEFYGIAEKRGTTRSAAALDLWIDRLAGAVVAIGNAPTALFRLLDLLDAGAPKPAAILGIPVGFVGAAESKAALAAEPRGIPFIVVRGRMGGSAMCAAAVNALARTGL